MKHLLGKDSLFNAMEKDNQLVGGNRFINNNFIYLDLPKGIIPVNILKS